MHTWWVMQTWSAALRLQRARPHLQTVVDLPVLQLCPLQPHLHAGLRRIAALAPECIVGPVVGWAACVVRVALDRAERGQGKPPQRTRVRFTLVEKACPMPCPR